MDATDVTIVCAFRNERRYLPELIESINLQSVSGFCAIFVDDGSTDGGASIIREQASFPFVILRNDLSGGLVASLNRALSECKTSLVCRVDADDIMLPRRIAWQLEIFNADEDTVLVGGMVRKMNEAGADTGVLRLPMTNRDCQFALNFYSPFIHPAVMYLKEVAISCGGYRAAEFPAEDFGLWVRMAARGKVANTSREVLRYRIRKGSITDVRRHEQLEVHAAIVDEAKVQPWFFAMAWRLHVTKLVRLFGVFSWGQRKVLIGKVVRVFMQAG